LEEWLQTHGPNDRTLAQGLKGDPTYLVVEQDKTLASYGINAVCTHLGCVVPWNSAENKFICPCHGSQYNNQGKVVRGPAPLVSYSCFIRLIKPLLSASSPDDAELIWVELLLFVKRPTTVAGPGARGRRRRQGPLRPVGGDRLQDRRGPLVEGVSRGAPAAAAAALTVTGHWPCVVPAFLLRGRYCWLLPSRLYMYTTHCMKQEHMLLI
jgi:nitrite reductase/ring-hydroxylating ferredoxin subunit